MRQGRASLSLSLSLFFRSQGACPDAQWPPWKDGKWKEVLGRFRKTEARESKATTSWRRWSPPCRGQNDQRDRSPKPWLVALASSLVTQSGDCVLTDQSSRERVSSAAQSREASIGISMIVSTVFSMHRSSDWASSADSLGRTLSMLAVLSRQLGGIVVPRDVFGVAKTLDPPR